MAKARQPAAAARNIESWECNRLIPYARNARVVSDAAVAKVAASIHEFGFKNPIIVDGEGVIIAGHTRLLAAQRLGLEKVPVLVADDLTPAQVKAYRLADNRTGQETKWDIDLLLVEMEDLLDHDFDLTLTGFDDGELERAVKSRPKRGETFSDVADLHEKDIAAKYKHIKTCVVDFSGGKDSTAAALWAKINLPRAEIKAMYCDLGAEHPGYLTHILKSARQLELEVAVVRTEKTVLEAFLERGWPIWMGPYCQTMMHKAMAGFVRQFDPKVTMRITGSRGKQRKATSTRLPSDPLPSTPEYTHLAPLFYRTDDAVLAALSEAGVRLWSGYERGFARTCCWCCPGQKPTTYAAMRREEPTLFTAYQDLEGMIGSGFWQETCKRAGDIAGAADVGDKMLAKIAQGKTVKGNDDVLPAGPADGLDLD